VVKVGKMSWLPVIGFVCKHISCLFSLCADFNCVVVVAADIVRGGTILLSYKHIHTHIRAIILLEDFTLSQDKF